MLRTVTQINQDAGHNIFESLKQFHMRPIIRSFENQIAAIKKFKM